MRSSGVSARDALGAVDLDRAVDRVVQHLRADDLDEPDLDPRRIALIDLVRGVEREQPARLDLGGGLEDHVLDRLLLGQRRAERDAGVGALAHQIEGALRLAEPAHAVEDAARTEPLLRDQEALAALAEQVAARHAHVVVRHLAVAADACPCTGVSRTMS